MCLMKPASLDLYCFHSVCEYMLLGGILQVTVKHVLSSHSKIDKTKISMTNGCLMKVDSIAECILQYFRPALSDNRS